MGKRSNFERKKGDFYPTPFEPCAVLFPFLPPRTCFIEPCAGDGRMIEHFESQGHNCIYACDIDPQADGIEKRDVLTCFDGNLLSDGFMLPRCEMIITNPPWERAPLHAMIGAFTSHADTWLLFDADWKETLQAGPFGALCRDIVPVGRVSWEGNGVAGKENSSWYRFSKKGHGTQFHFRA